MKDRIRLLWFLHTGKRRGTKHWFSCHHPGCLVKVSDTRFLFLGCECRMHRWLRRWGGLEH
jgi:hypothetical protein